MRTCIIANPNAGSAGGEEELRTLLASVGADRIYVMDEARNGEDCAREAVAVGFDFIAVAGGDGTLNEVVNGILATNADAAIALLPIGTGNDFARSLALPGTFAGCVEVLRAGKTAAVDAVRVCCDCTRYFVNVATGGSSGAVNEHLTPEVKRSWGPLAYLRSAAEAFSRIDTYCSDVTLDGTAYVGKELYTVVVANGRYCAGGIPIAPDAEIDDGLLDVLLVPQLSGGEMALAAAQTLVGKHLANESLLFARAAHVEVASKPPMHFNIDGETISNAPMTFDIVPSALQFVVP